MIRQFTFGFLISMMSSCKNSQYCFRKPRQPCAMALIPMCTSIYVSLPTSKWNWKKMVAWWACFGVTESGCLACTSTHTSLLGGSGKISVNRWTCFRVRVPRTLDYPTGKGAALAAAAAARSAIGGGSMKVLKGHTKYNMRKHFYRATAYNATHGIAVAILFVRPSVCQMHVLWQNEIIDCQKVSIPEVLNTVRNRDISSFSTPTGVVGNCLLSPEIFAESDPPPSKKRRLRHISAYNLSTVYNNR